MNRRHRDADTGDITSQLKPLTDDDAFLSDLSRGIDPSEGTDELAGLLLALREDVEKQMPPAPVIEGADEEPAVISLADRRRRRRSRPLLSGLIGAAAATLVIAGSGAAIYNATPGSPLWGISSTLFSDRAAVVELAGTLEEMDSLAAEGDMDGTRQLLEEARRLLRDGDNRDPRTGEPTAPGTTTSVVQNPTTATTTVTRPEDVPAEPSAPETVTETAVVTETSVATVTVTQGPPPVRPNPLPVPTPQEPVDPAPGDGAAPTPTLAPPQVPDAGAAG